MVFDIAQIIVGKGAGAFVFLSACHHRYSIIKIILIYLFFLDLVFSFFFVPTSALGLSLGVDGLGVPE